MTFETNNAYDARIELQNALEKANNALRNGWISSARHAELVKKAHYNKARTESGYWDYKAWKQGA